MTTQILDVLPGLLKVSPCGARGRSSWSERAVLAALGRLRHGEIRLTPPQGRAVLLGEAIPGRAPVAVSVADARAFREIMASGSLGAAEAYLRGDWTTDDLPGLLRICCRNLDDLDRLDGGLNRLAQWRARAAHWLARNTEAGSRLNIAAHYDLGNDFFELFLDSTMMYSSGLFEHPAATLEEASLAKLDRIIRKLNLLPSDHVCEIGTGWGGFALRAASRTGCQVTTTTISRQQYDKASVQIAEAGLADRVTLLDQDYRHLQGRFDHVVSIEMIEAVGHGFLPGYFKKCHDLLRPGGCLMIQAITMPDRRYAAYLRQADFIQKYVFPGGHLPSIGAMQAAAAGTSFELIDVLQFADSYARTLSAWRAAFLSRLDQVRNLGFDERFIRMWDYYLSYCEAAFAERCVGVGQFIWQRTR